MTLHSTLYHLNLQGGNLLPQTSRKGNNLMINNLVLLHHLQVHLLPLNKKSQKEPSLLKPLYLTTPLKSPMSGVR